MLKMNELTDPTSCMSRAKDDEYVFVLLARDVTMPATLRYWAAQRIACGKNRPDDPQIVSALAEAMAIEQEHIAAGRLPLPENT